GDVELPDLTRAVPGATVRTDQDRLRAVYYDTADRHLQRHSVTLRRRVGGDDAGWHVKLPAETGRLELRVDARSTTVPRELSDLVKGVRLGQPLAVTAALETVRTRHQLLDGS